MQPIGRAVYSEKFSPEKVLKEILRHYTEFRELVNNGGNHVLEHSYEWVDEDGKKHKETLAFSFWDLHRGIKELPPRKREALYWNVIRDYKQRDVAEIMGITSVSVGQYCKLACEHLLQYHF